MGTWGAGIFDDDVAMDVRDTFEEALTEGMSVSSAAARVQEEYEDALADADDGPVVWLALAALQLEQGALQPDVRRRALAMIDQGEGLDRWEEAGEETLAERTQVLEEFGRRLQAATKS